jgi:hypothetical protein
VDLVKNPLLERVVQNPKSFFSAATFRDLAFRRLIQAAVVDGGGGLAGDADNKLLVLIDELSRLAMPKEKRADHFS